MRLAERAISIWRVNGTPDGIADDRAGGQVLTSLARQNVHDHPAKADVVLRTSIRSDCGVVVTTGRASRALIHTSSRARPVLHHDPRPRCDHQVDVVRHGSRGSSISVIAKVNAGVPSAVVLIGISMIGQAGASPATLKRWRILWGWAMTCFSKKPVPAMIEPSRWLLAIDLMVGPDPRSENDRSPTPPGIRATVRSGKDRGCCSVP